MYSFREVQKAKKKEVSGQRIRVAVVGNCATQFISDAICGYCRLTNLDVEVYDADYNQIDAQLLDNQSEVILFNPDYIVLWLASEKLYEDFLKTESDERPNFADGRLAKVLQYWNLIESKIRARILQPNFVEIDDRVLGNYSSKVSASFVYQIRKLNALLQEEMAKDGSVFPIDIQSIQNRMGRERFFNSALFYNSKMPIAIPALPEVGKAVSDVIHAVQGDIKKCIITDLDNTIWGGTVGDDGWDNIEIGELGRGRVFSDIQRWLKELKETGIILCVCSKNDEDKAKEPFIKNPEMVLRLEDISVFVASWEDKAGNIQLIRDTLNIGMNSIVFLDDNPFERDLVRQCIPELEVPELPENPEQYLGFLQTCNYFETASYTGKNSDRTRLYQAEFKRRQAAATYASIDEYLQSLEMLGEGVAFKPEQYSRIAQLTQRSNQFNLRTIRYTEADIKRIAEDEQYLTLAFSLKDKFGNHGLISVVILKKNGKQSLFVDTWLMSCRVLKRGMEEFVINKVAVLAQECGFLTIDAEYIPTPKNAMVKDIFSRMGFMETGENKYRLEVGEYKEQKTYISSPERL